MKKYYLFVLLLFPVLSFGQTALPEPPLNFCGIDIPVPVGCTAENKYKISCEKYELSWMYLNFGQLNPVVEDMVRAEKKKHKPAEERPLQGTILGVPAKGHHLSYTTERGMGYQLILYGMAKGQPVVVQLTMDLDPEKTADLPEPARLIVGLTK